MESAKLKAVVGCITCDYRIGPIAVDDNFDGLVTCWNPVLVEDQKSETPQYTTRFERTLRSKIPCFGYKGRDEDGGNSKK